MEHTADAIFDTLQKGFQSGDAFTAAAHDLGRKSAHYVDRRLEHFADQLASQNPRAEMSRMLTLMEDYEKSGDMEGARQIVFQLLGKDYMKSNNDE